MSYVMSYYDLGTIYNAKSQITSGTDMVKFYRF